MLDAGRSGESLETGSKNPESVLACGTYTNKQISSQLGDAWLGAVCAFAVFAATAVGVEAAPRC